MKTTRTLICLVISICCSRAEAQTAHLTLQSQPGDFIGGGQNYDITFTPENSYFFSSQVRRSLPSGAPAELLFVLGLGQSTPVALLFFGTDKLDTAMQRGFYANAQRADFASAGHPGLDVSFDSRGCNTDTGNFTVTDFVYSPALGIESFSATFEQHCEGGPAALFGTFSFQAAPEPSAMALFGLSCIGAMGFCSHRKFRRAG